ncbi:MAG TPA: NAD(P)/FAD-dependent oxidoreductase [Syntrophales bacterium]|nr:NAD(P)/FAD-dependent oxidoreductase [Syntrophales bacterium]
MRLLIDGLRFALRAEPDGKTLAERVASVLGVRPEEISSLRVVRRSVDARRRREPRIVLGLEVTVPDGAHGGPRKEAGVSIRSADAPWHPPASRGRPPGNKRPVVVGCGPAGLFAALALAMGGCPPVLLERGRPLAERAADVREFWERGRLNPESNVQFGEGGAGAFSDGKLTSRLRDPRGDWVKKIFVESGAPASILTDAKPHVGTDRLRAVVASLRKRLVEAGVEIRFGAAVTGLIVRNGAAAGVVVGGGEEIAAESIVFAAGQSAEDTYGMLERSGLSLSAKPFAIGLRVEHPQDLVDRIQYGRWREDPQLPPAEYFLTARLDSLGRSVYTFCMCPGGQVIGSSSEAGRIVTNGMSNSRRNGPFANAAVVVNVRTEDFDRGSPLDGLAFRRRWEEKAFAVGGGDYAAPAQRLVDFLRGEASPSIGRHSFLPRVRAARLDDALPPFAAEAIREGLKVFGRKMPGFLSEEALLIGVETRTSSPVRILRGPDGTAVGVAGFYPCGEGSGYAGGIISSAVDGIRVAESILAAAERTVTPDFSRA